MRLRETFSVFAGLEQGQSTQDHQGVLINRVDMKQIELHATGDIRKCWNPTCQHTGLCHLDQNANRIRPAQQLHELRTHPCIGIHPCGEFLLEGRLSFGVEFGGQRPFAVAGVGQRPAGEVDQRDSFADDPEAWGSGGT